MSAETEILKALQRFESRIMIDSTGVSTSVFNDTVARNVKIAYYIAGGSATGIYFGGPKYVYDICYQNTEVAYADIHVVSSSAEIQSIFCQYIGNFKTRLVLLARPGIDVNSEYNKFKETKSAFYSNYRGMTFRSGMLSLANVFFYDYCFDYRIGKVKLQMMENDTKAEIARIAKMLFLPGMSNETKAFLAHNYLAHTIVYTNIEKRNSLQASYIQSAYGGLINKKCVCQGYAEAFKRLLDYAGIPCDVVCGQIIGHTSYHAWNILKLNDGCDNYHIDVTWDSSNGEVSYKYFGLKDSDLYSKRTWNREFNVKCNSSKNLLLEARQGIVRFKSQLISNGVSTKILGF